MGNWVGGWGGGGGGHWLCFICLLLHSIGFMLFIAKSEPNLGPGHPRLRLEISCGTTILPHLDVVEENHNESHPESGALTMNR